MDCFLGRREFDVEEVPFAGRGANVNLSGVFLDDAVAHRKAQAGAAALALW